MGLWRPAYRALSVKIVMLSRRIKLQREHLKSELQSYVASLHRKPSSETVRGGVKRKAASLSIPLTSGDFIVAVELHSGCAASR